MLKPDAGWTQKGLNVSNCLHEYYRCQNLSKNFSDPADAHDHMRFSPFSSSGVLGMYAAFAFFVTV